MSQPIIPRDEVARQLAVPGPRPRPLRGARAGPLGPRGRASRGTRPAEVRRLWAIVSYQRDLGINLAGVEAVLKLRDHLADVHRRLDALAGRLREALEVDDRPTTTPMPEPRTPEPRRTELRRLLDRPDAAPRVRRAVARLLGVSVVSIGVVGAW